MASKTLSVRLEPQLVDRLSEMAAAMDRPRAWLMAHAIRSFVEHEEWFVEAVQAGLDSADAGRLVEHDRVASWVASWDSADEQEPPGCD